jgi:hypothetical protein
MALGLARPGVADPLAAMQQLLSTALSRMCFEMVMQPGHRFYVRVLFDDAVRLAQGTFQLQIDAQNWIGFVFTRQEGPPVPANPYSRTLLIELAEHSLQMPGWTGFCLQNLERLLTGTPQPLGVFHVLARPPGHLMAAPALRDMCTLVFQMLTPRRDHLRFDERQPGHHFFFPDTGSFVRLDMRDGIAGYVALPPLECMQHDLDEVAEEYVWFLDGWTDFDLQNLDFLVSGRLPAPGVFRELARPPRDNLPMQAFKGVRLWLCALLHRRGVAHKICKRKHTLSITGYGRLRPANDWFQLELRRGVLGYVRCEPLP